MKVGLLRRLGGEPIGDALPARISVRDLAKRYGRVEAIRGVSLEVAPGEVFGLLGRNGAGKTTTIECVLGLRRPDFGAVNIGGIDALAEPQRARAIIGAQLQGAQLQDRITPRQAIRFFRSFYAEAESADALLERFTLTQKADAPFESLSGGQRQRLFLALAFVHRPRVVVLDEPTAGLDAPARRELHAVIAGFRSAGVTVLLSTHDLDEAEHLCDVIGILHDGCLVARGTPAQLVAAAPANPRIVLRTSRPAPSDEILRLPGVLAVAVRGSECTVDTNDVHHAILELVRHLDSRAIELQDLKIRRPSLEDVFVELTGRVRPAEGGQ